MDILKPELIWVDGRCYRLSEGSGIQRNITPYVEDDCGLDYEEELSDTDIEIEPHGATKFKHTFHVAKAFFPFIVGSKSAVCHRIEAETKTVIQLPKVGQDGDIVITGSHRKGIISARHRIDMIVETSRRRLQPTHFISIPLNDGHIIMKFNAFKNDVLTKTGKGARGIDEVIFQTPSKLHLTIGMLTLTDDAERHKAIEALDYCKEHVIKPIIGNHGQIKIRLQGTEIMNDDPAEAKVLYAKIISTNDVLQELADKIADHYADTGLLQKKMHKVKLHTTLMNTSFKLEDDEKRNAETFDATAILKEHQDTFFGETVLNEIHVSQRHTISNSGYYQATAKINLAGE